MFNEETRRKTSGTDSSQVFVTEKSGRSKSRGPRGHGWSPSRSKSRFRGACHHCGKKGHVKKNCRVWKREDIEWIFDNGASFHATSKQEFFSTYKEGDSGIVKMGNESYSKFLELNEDKVRRSSRSRRPFTKYSSSEYIMLTNYGEPETYEEARAHNDSDIWMKAMELEMDSR
ncbi:hypothetical protein D8674_007983 [Pyrus ussuriensis x Pyrus communis]|uniref:CCHC-type domain-containing protein n=1 Tax=Pyrus ussuriensis x Pyrus communis TaxID=2448454 RepID=A0A5N5I4D2_9ROSA|nr:hypothetical protein D8674_007983 [Pyrus ussuriensis x Pyrus communis]